VDVLECREAATPTVPVTALFPAALAEMALVGFPESQPIAGEQAGSPQSTERSQVPATHEVVDAGWSGLWDFLAWRQQQLTAAGAGGGNTAVASVGVDTGGNSGTQGETNPFAVQLSGLGSADGLGQAALAAAATPRLSGPEQPDAGHGPGDGGAGGGGGGSGGGGGGAANPSSGAPPSPGGNVGGAGAASGQQTGAAGAAGMAGKAGIPLPRIAPSGQGTPGAPVLHQAPTPVNQPPVARVSAPPVTAQAAVAQNYGQLPLRFEANVGQTDPQVKFLSRGPGYALFLTATEAVLSLQKAPVGGPAGVLGLRSALDPAGKPTAGDAPAAGDVVRIQLVGANPDAQAVGQQQLPGTSNYFIGNDPTKWQTDVPSYGQVVYHDVYPGVDVVYHGGSQRQLEYDFMVAPGSDPGAIRLAFHGAQTVSLDGQGNLVVHTPGGDLVEHAPALYQEVNGERQAIAGQFVLDGAQQLRFEVGTFDPGHALVIDPSLSYSTYVGGRGSDIANGIAVDGSGNAYIVGTTQSANFPTASPLQGTNAGTDDVFVTKLNARGTALVYSTYLGGGWLDEGKGIAVDASGNAYVTGSTLSSNFPTANALQATFAGGLGDAFVTKLNATGSGLVYSTYLGGSDSDGAAGITVDSSGNAYVAGGTSSTNFPTAKPTPGHERGGQ
jgi:hypothetical protein